MKDNYFYTEENVVGFKSTIDQIKAARLAEENPSIEELTEERQITNRDVARREVACGSNADHFKV